MCRVKCSPVLGWTLSLFFWCRFGANAVLELTQCPIKSMSQYQILRSDDLPLCGNGVLDAGEVCDDGNRIGGDGCNGWCSAFDRMTKACTLAGQNNECPTMGGTLASSPSQSTFCSLSSVAASPDGKYLVVADGGVLVRMDLFTDSVMQNLFILPASLYYKFGRFCSIFILPNGGGEDHSILGHDCETQQIYLFTNGGEQYSMKRSLPLQPLIQGVTNKGYMDYEGNLLVIAGLPQIKDGFRCVEVYGVDLNTFERSLLGTVDCVVFNVMEVGKTYTSFSMDGMIPYRVLRDACPYQMNSVHCYVVYMERNDMQTAKAYLPLEGGGDAEYIVSTDETLNVLGAPVVTRSESSQMTYTLIGNCFYAANTVLSTLKMMPPVISLGNSCGAQNLNSKNMPCATPLNNPFITDIVSSSYLLPNGLSATHEHQELLSIFMNGNASALLNSTSSSGTTTTTSTTSGSSSSSSSSTSSSVNMFLGGLPLYRQILDNTHRGNVPIDFVELPSTRDIIYITKTSIGMINTKGVMLMDIYNPGYCRPVDAILCPSGYYGSVGGVCRSCSEEDDTGALDTVSAQIQCTGMILKTNRRRRHLLSLSQTAPFTQVSMIVSSAVKKQDLDNLMNFYLMAHGFNCSEASALSGYQPYNLAADLQDAQAQGQAISSGSAPQGKCTELIPCLIDSAGNLMKKNLTLQTPEEYLVAWTMQKSTLVDALTGITDSASSSKQIHPIVREDALKCGLDGDILTSLETSNCRFSLNKDFHSDWLPCALSILNANMTGQTAAGGGRRRSLLQANNNNNNDANAPIMLATSQAQSTFISMTSVSYGVLSQNNGGGGSPGTNNNGGGNGKSGTTSGDGGNNVFVMVVVGGSIAGVLIAMLVVLIIYMYLVKNRKFQNQGSMPLYNNDAMETRSLLKRR